MKKLVCSFLSSVLLIGCCQMYAFAGNSTDSQQITLDGAFENLQNKPCGEEKVKVKVFSSEEEGAAAVREIIKGNSEVCPGTAENCLIVKTDQELSFDTSKVASAVRYGDLYYIQYQTSQDAQNAAADFQSDPSVDYAVPDEEIVVAFDAQPNSDDSASQDANGYRHYSWGVNVIKADVLADYVSKRTDGSAVVAVIDSGVDSSHPYLAGKILSGCNLIDQSQPPDDDYGHGTHIAGIIADCTQGVDVKILPVKVLDSEGHGNLSTIAEGISYAVSQEADVILFNIPELENSESQRYIDDAIDKAIAQDICVVSPSGDQYADTADYCPVHRTDLIVTAALDSDYANMHGTNGTGEVFGSNYGTTVDLSAPGVAVMSCAPYDLFPSGYVASTGTSMAAAHIAAGAAMLRILYPAADPVQIENLLKSCARDLGTAGDDTTYGAGIPDFGDLIPDLPFGDVHAGDWFYEAVLDVYTRGYMTGKGDTGNFDPMSYMLRQDVAVLCYRIAGSPAVGYRTIYPDVDLDDYFASAAVWAYDSGVITGNNGKFGAWSNVYRQDFALILYRFANHLGLDTSARGDLSGYPDAGSTSEYAKEGVEWAVGAGIMGQSVENLSPMGYVNRAEVAAMISRFLTVYGI